MEDREMTTNEAIQELIPLGRLFRAYQRLKNVLESAARAESLETDAQRRHQEVEDMIGVLEKKRADIESAIEEISKNLRDAEQRHDSTLNTYAQMVEKHKKETEERLRSLSQMYREREKRHHESMAKMNKEISERQAILSNLTSQINSMMEKLGDLTKGGD